LPVYQMGRVGPPATASCTEKGTLLRHANRRCRKGGDNTDRVSIATDRVCGAKQENPSEGTRSAAIVQRKKKEPLVEHQGSRPACGTLRKRRRYGPTRKGHRLQKKRGTAPSRDADPRTSAQKEKKTHCRRSLAGKRKKGGKEGAGSARRENGLCGADATEKEEGVGKKETGRL